MALAAGRGTTSLWIALAVGSGQLFVGWSNDYLDRDRDRIAERADKPIATGEIEASTVGRAAIVALPLCIGFSLAVGLLPGAVHLVLVALAALYNLRLKTTPLSVVPYALAFGLLPLFVTLAPPRPHLPPLWLPLAAATLGAGAHFMQALPDIEADRRQGHGGLPQRVGRLGSVLTAAALLMASALTVAVGPARISPVAIAALALTAALVAAILLSALRHRDRLAFRLTLATAAVVLASFLAGSASR